MGRLVSSASKIVFLMVAFTVCLTFGLGILSEKEFVPLAGMSFIYYFMKRKPEDEPTRS